MAMQLQTDQAALIVELSPACACACACASASGTSYKPHRPDSAWTDSINLTTSLTTSGAEYRVGQESQMK